MKLSADCGLFCASWITKIRSKIIRFKLKMMSLIILIKVNYFFHILRKQFPRLSPIILENIIYFQRMYIISVSIIFNYIYYHLQCEQKLQNLFFRNLVTCYVIIQRVVYFYFFCVFGLPFLQTLQISLRDRKSE